MRSCQFPKPAERRVIQRGRAFGLHRTFASLVTWATATGASARHRRVAVSCTSTSSQRCHAVVAPKPPNQAAVYIPVHIGWSIVTRLTIGAMVPPFTLITGTTIVLPLCSMAAQMC
jgi:hypothetical protein